MFALHRLRSALCASAVRDAAALRFGARALAQHNLSDDDDGDEPRGGSRFQQRGGDGYQQQRSGGRRDGAPRREFRRRDGPTEQQSPLRTQKNGLYDAMRAADVQRAVQLLDEFEAVAGVKPDTDCYNLSLGAAVNAGDFDMVGTLRARMAEAGQAPNTRTFNALMSLELAKAASAVVAVANDMVAAGETGNLATVRLMLRVARNPAHLERAEEVLTRMNEANVVPSRSECFGILRLFSVAGFRDRGADLLISLNWLQETDLAFRRNPERGDSKLD